MFFEKDPSKLEIFLNTSTFKTQENRDRDLKEMEIEQKKLLKREEKRKTQTDKPKKEVNIVPTILFNVHGEPVVIERDLTWEEKWLDGMMERGHFKSEKSHGKFLGDGQPKTDITTYTNYDEIEIEVVPEGTTGKKWNQLNKGKK